MGDRTFLRAAWAWAARGAARHEPELSLCRIGKRIDAVAYMRFASVYKDFQEFTDFEHELGLLLQKKVPSHREP